MDCPDGKEIIVTSEATSIHRGNTRCMQPCDYKEADTRLIIHLKGACLNNCSKCLVHTVDTDIVVILIGKFHYLLTLSQDINIWVAFGTGKNFAYYHINARLAEIIWE